MTLVTPSELSERCPLVYVECLGKRQFARSSNVDGRCRIQIMDTDTLANMDVDSVLEVSWEDVAFALNNACPIRIPCVKKDANG